MRSLLVIALLLAYVSGAFGGEFGLPDTRFKPSGILTSAGTGLTQSAKTVSLTSPVTVAHGGTNATAAGATAANNIGALAESSNLSDLNSASTSRTNLGLGTAATQNTGTSGANIPFLNGLNTWSGASSWTALQQFGSADLAVLGTSTGYDLLETANTSASNFTHTFPAATDTIADTSTAQTFTNKSISSGQITGLGTAATVNTGTSGATIPLLNGANTWSGLQQYTNGDLAMVGSSTGYDLLETANSGASNFTHTFPAATDTIADTSTAQTFTNKSISSGQITGLGTAATVNTGTSGATIPLLNAGNTWSGLQQYTSGDLAMLGSSTGYDLLETANSGASNFTHTFPAATDTIADTSSSQTFTNKSIAGSEINSGNIPFAQMPTLVQAMTTVAAATNYGGL